MNLSHVSLYICVLSSLASFAVCGARFSDDFIVLSWKVSDRWSKHLIPTARIKCSAALCKSRLVLILVVSAIIFSTACWHMRTNTLIAKPVENKHINSRTTRRVKAQISQRTFEQGTMKITCRTCTPSTSLQQLVVLHHGPPSSSNRALLRRLSSPHRSHAARTAMSTEYRMLAAALHWGSNGAGGGATSTPSIALLSGKLEQA